MPKPPLPDHIRAFLAHPQPAVIASVRPDGQPVSVATWYLLDGEKVLVNMGASPAGRYRPTVEPISRCRVHDPGPAAD